MINDFTYFNGEYVQSSSMDSHSNRGFMYGDGVFETIIYKNGTLQFFEDHHQRLAHALQTLSIEFNHSLDSLKTITLELLGKKQLIDSSVRIKIIVYRNTGGLYTPSQNSSSILISAIKYIQPNTVVSSLGVCKTITLAKSWLGNLKTLNSLPYVLASIEKKKSEYDELVILNNEGHICECTSSNIFWKKNEIYYTPSLETGCIAGIMRKQTISKLRKEGKSLLEGHYSIKELNKAEEIFVTNVTGKKTVENFNPN